jgi:hypothetical protein
VSGSVFKLGEDDGYANSLEVMAYGGRASIEVENPWAGDSETGFGASCSISLSAADALRFGEWLVAEFGPQPEGEAP